MSVKNVFDKLGALSKIGSGLGLATSLYALILGIYPKPFNLLIVTSLLMLIAEALELYKAGLRTIVKPVILGSSLGLAIIYVFMINDVVSTTVFVNQIAIIVFLVIGVILSILTALLKLFG